MWDSLDDNTSLFLFKTFLNLNKKFLIMFENDVVSLIWCFVEIYVFVFFLTRSSNIVYREFFFFFLNFFFTSFFIFIFANFSSAFIIFFFFSFFLYSFTVMSQHWTEKLFQQFVFSFSSNIFEKKKNFFAEIVLS